MVEARMGLINEQTTHKVKTDHGTNPEEEMAGRSGA